MEQTQERSKTPWGNPEPRNGRGRNYRLKLVQHALPSAVVDELLANLADDVVHHMYVDGGDVGRHSKRSIALASRAGITARNRIAESGSGGGKSRTRGVWSGVLSPRELSEQWKGREGSISDGKAGN
ncbi:hypothetical protein B296_00026245 [Ensete ventricosum]|uniref:Uncharacterized protein n=1 Tax=Ensete ventricosum TaxID=4639 RepID=A0A426ZKG4_ENSVE|nr:hypothetical protein B296_00026245 [Ensete ventricosum]